MTLSNKANTLIKKLRLFGYNIEVFEKSIRVQLPLFCSVNIFEDGETLKADPRFGAMSRTNATLMNQVLLLISLVLISFFTDDNRLQYFFAVSMLFSGFWDVYRYILTENFVSRFQSLLSGEQRNEV